MKNESNTHGILSAKRERIFFPLSPMSESSEQSEVVPKKKHNRNDFLSLKFIFVFFNDAFVSS